MAVILTCCPTLRAGVLFAGRADGILEAWDLLDRSHEPVLVTAASTAAVISLAFSHPPPPHPKGRSAQQLLAVGAHVLLITPPSFISMICEFTLHLSLQEGSLELKLPEV